MSPRSPTFFGSRRMTVFLERSGETVNRKRVRRLMALMGLEAVHPRPRTTVAGPDARAYPYLLRDRQLCRIDEVRSSDITYGPMRRGFMYLTAVIDWYSRYVLSWRLSNTPEGRFCLEAIHPGPRTTTHDPGHKVYPYLLRGVEVERRDQVWSSDITYIPMHQGFMYLTAVIDWYSRYVLSWSLSNSLDGRSCLEALEEALSGGRPETFNTDQGVQ